MPALTLNPQLSSVDEQIFRVTRIFILDRGVYGARNVGEAAAADMHLKGRSNVQGGRSGLAQAEHVKSNSQTELENGPSLSHSLLALPDRRHK